MLVTRTIAELRAALAGHDEINFVPTMGNLHEGHLSLVRTARERAGLVVASVFVNPLQFAPHEDFETYPRTLERDREVLAAGGCDVLFAPSVAEMYPEAQSFKVQPPSALADILEGSVRPGFFVGVCTVVCKLLNIVRPACAVFGKKDYQQWRVIEGMVRQLALPVEILAAETVRDMDGLALSSRNRYLSAQQRARAAELNEVLRGIASQARVGDGDWAALEARGRAQLERQDWVCDYIAIRQRHDLAPPSGAALIVLGAARLGGTRLIDNIEI